jgi:hypothetical protein
MPRKKGYLKKKRRKNIYGSTLTESELKEASRERESFAEANPDEGSSWTKVGDEGIGRMAGFHMGYAIGKRKCRGGG